MVPTVECSMHGRVLYLEMEHLLEIYVDIRCGASYHSARVYFQVQQWMGKWDNLDPK